MAKSTTSKTTAASVIASAQATWAAADAAEKSGTISATEAATIKDNAHTTAEAARSAGGFTPGGDDGSLSTSQNYIRDNNITTRTSGTISSNGNVDLRITVSTGKNVLVDETSYLRNPSGEKAWVDSSTGKVYYGSTYTGYTVVTSGHHHSSGDRTVIIDNHPVVVVQDPPRKSVTKKEYVYGIKEIKITGIACEKNSIYVSTPYKVPGNIAEIELSSEEVHPLYDSMEPGVDNLRNTSIEYYVSYADNQWIPILPKYETQVVNELLFIKNQEATFRFPAQVASDITVYEDGKLYTKWHLAPAGKGIIFKELPKARADYTVNYIPDSTKTNPYIVKVSEHGIVPTKYTNEHNEEGELFNGTKPNCTIQLSYTPYIDYNTINQTTDYNPNTSSYKPIQVYLEDGKIVIPNNKTTTSVDPYINADTICTKNMTDYINRADVQLSPYSLIKKVDGKPTNMVFEYKQDKDKITFTETFKESDNIDNLDISKATAKIRVKYSYLASGIRVKIILRRTGSVEETSLRPYINQYALYVKTLE